MKYRNTLAIVGLFAAFTLPVYAADDAAKAPDAGLTRTEAKDLKTQSEADYKAQKKVVDANAEMAEADCKTSLEGGAKRACKKAVKHHAKAGKAEAKMVHEAEEKAIKDAKK